MQATFRMRHLWRTAVLILLRALPPPTTGSRRLMRQGRTGAGRATNRAIALGIEPVDRYLMRLDVIPHRLLGPVGQRVVFGNIANRVVFDHVQSSTTDCLLAALSGNPGLLALQRTQQGFDLAQVTAFLTQRLT